jgi:quinol monooxygenase YgiN
MSSAVHWVLELAIKDGEFGAFETLMNDMVSAARANEPGTTHYEWFLSDDKSRCHTYERFVDSAAAMTHLGNFGAHFAERFIAVFEPTRLTVFGDPSAEVRGALAGFGAVHMEMAGGFAR